MREIIPLMTSCGLVDLGSGDGFENITVDAVIAHLLKTKRFNGHFPQALDVARHSLACAMYADPRDHLLPALCAVHDFSEYLTGDVPSPALRYMEAQVFLLDKLQRKLATSMLGPHAGRFDRRVLEVDKCIAMAEMHELGFPDSVLSDVDYEAMSCVRSVANMSDDTVMEGLKSFIRRFDTPPTR